MRQEKSAGAVIFKMQNNEPYFLLLKYPNYWGFAKGWIEEGETEEQAAVREVKEETNLQIKIIPEFRFEQKWMYKFENEWSRKQAAFFLAQVPENSEVKISEEHEDFAWKNYPDASKICKIKNNKEMLTAANEFILKNFKQDKQKTLNI
jgi:8-oxo-dGTP pyrophosphatase MutT (NUDIX family)